MSMSTRAVGFRPPDSQWKKMKAAWEACEAAGADVPAAVEQFFGEEPPGDRPGMEVPLGDACVDYAGESESGYDVDVSKLPDSVKVIRFCNSW